MGNSPDPLKKKKKKEQSFNLTARLFSIKRLETSPLSRFFLITAYGRKNSINNHACAVVWKLPSPTDYMYLHKRIWYNLWKRNCNIVPPQAYSLPITLGHLPRKRDPGWDPLHLKGFNIITPTSEEGHVAMLSNIMLMSRPVLWMSPDLSFRLEVPFELKLYSWTPPLTLTQPSYVSFSWTEERRHQREKRMKFHFYPRWTIFPLILSHTHQDTFQGRNTR